MPAYGSARQWAHYRGLKSCVKQYLPFLGNGCVGVALAAIDFFLIAEWVRDPGRG
jgi:hypothetical protein